MLKFYVNNQNISRIDDFLVVADSRNYLKAEFVFSDEWSGAITAVFKCDDTSICVLLEDGRCNVPWEVIRAPHFSVSVFCGDRITANTATVSVEASGFAEGETPAEPTPDVYSILLSISEETREIAQGVRSDADEGVLTAELEASLAACIADVRDVEDKAEQLAQGKVDKAENKGLSTNDYTDNDKSKLAGIDENANNYTLPEAGEVLGGVLSGGDVCITDGIIRINAESVIDSSLTQAGKAADAKKVGDEIERLNVKAEADLEQIEAEAKAYFEGLKAESDAELTAAINAAQTAAAEVDAIKNDIVSAAAEVAGEAIREVGDVVYLPKAAAEGAICSTVLSNSGKTENYQVYGNSEQTSTPSPNNVAEIQSTGDLVTDIADSNYGKYKVTGVVMGDNPLKPISRTTTINNVTFTLNDDASITVSGLPAITTLTQGKSIMLQAGTYTLYDGNANGTDTSQVRLLCRYKNDLGGTIFIYNRSFTLTKPTLVEYYIQVSPGDTIEQIRLYPQLDVGGERKAFRTPYEYTLTAYLDEPLRKIGDYADYIDWKEQAVVRRVGEVRLNSQSSIREWTSDGVKYGYYYPAINSPSTNNTALSNYFKSSPGAAYPTNYDNAIVSRGTSIFFGTDMWDTVEAFKAWLSTVDLRVDYILATPGKTALELEPIELCKGSNTVCITTQTQPSNIKVDYYQNPTLVIEELRNAILAQGGNI